MEIIETCETTELHNIILNLDYAFLQQDNKKYNDIRIKLDKIASITPNYIATAIYEAAEISDDNWWTCGRDNWIVKATEIIKNLQKV